MRMVDIPDDKIIAYAKRVLQAGETVVTFKLGCDCLGRPELWEIMVDFTKVTPTVKRTQLR